MPRLDDRIAQLEAKLKQEKAKKQQADARQRAAAAKRQRQDDTRRKVLVGALVLARAERDGAAHGELIATLDRALTRADDRALFGLASTTAHGGRTPERDST